MSLTGPMTARRSNAKTAYGLMSDIKAYILEEPKRVWMGDWIIQGSSTIEAILDAEGPACGTVGCIAGNAIFLTGGIKHGRSVYSEAVEMLSGKNYDLMSDLCGLFLNTDVKAKYGTERYARIVAKRIEGFQTEHEAALRAVNIEAPGPKGNRR